MNHTKLRASFVFAVGLSLTAVSSSASAQNHGDVVREWNAGWATLQSTDESQLASLQQTLTVDIHAPIATVFDIYTNVDNDIGRHPFLVGVLHVRDHGGPDHVEVHDFIALENIPLPDGTILPGRTITESRVYPTSYTFDTVTYDAPGVITRQHVTFTDVGGGNTRVTEYLTFEATPDLVGFALFGGVTAHQIMQQAIKADIESGALQASDDHGYAHGHSHE